MASRRRALLMATAIADFFARQQRAFGDGVTSAIDALKNLREQQRIKDSFGRDWGYGRDRSRTHRVSNSRDTEYRRRQARNLQRRLSRERGLS